MGLGGSTFYLSLIRELKGCFSDKNFGIAISVMLCIGYAGGIAANAPFVFLMQYINWREILVILGFVILAGVILFALLSRHIEFPAINRTVKLRTLPFRLVLHKNTIVIYSVLPAATLEFLIQYRLLSVRSSLKIFVLCLPQRLQWSYL